MKMNCQSTEMRKDEGFLGKQRDRTLNIGADS
jgi:hypothetical protein